MHSTAPLRVYLLDPFATSRRAWRRRFAAAGDIEVVGESDSAVKALEPVRTLRPDVAILSSDLPDGSGFSACRIMLADTPGLATLLIASDENGRTRADAYRAGASGCVLVSAGDDYLLYAVRRAAAGHSLYGDQEPSRPQDAAPVVAVQRSSSSIARRPWPR
ncbi:hypothetical protein GCM10027020_07570 [Nocardioides salsibiostraticola]